MAQTTHQKVLSNILAWLGKNLCLNVFNQLTIPAYSKDEDEYVILVRASPGGSEFCGYQIQSEHSYLETVTIEWCDFSYKTWDYESIRIRFEIAYVYDGGEIYQALKGNWQKELTNQVREHLAQFNNDNE